MARMILSWRRSHPQSARVPDRKVREEPLSVGHPTVETRTPRGIPLDSPVCLDVDFESPTHVSYSSGGRTMTPEERERLEDLCRRVAEEKDPLTFEKLVLELNELLEQKHSRIHPNHKTTPD